MAYSNPQIQGWMSDGCLEWLYRTAGKMQSVVEVGSWKGRSTHALLSACVGPVFAVDHFKGTPDERGNAHLDVTRFDIFAQFWENVGKFPNLVVMRMSSAQAAQYFGDGSVDMVFIDGDHSTAAVRADILAWGPKCRRLLCGHDAEFESVRAALGEYKYDTVPNINIWRIPIGTEENALHPESQP